MNTENNGYTLTEVAKFYLEDTDYQKRVGTTISGYKSLLNNHILPLKGNKKIRYINENDCEDIYNDMRKKINPNTGNPLTETQIHHVHALIKAIFNYTLFKKWLIINPVMFVKNPPKSDTKEREYYDYNEQQEALGLLDKHIIDNGLTKEKADLRFIRFKTAITILFNTGFRRGELIGLKWKDINFKTKTFKVRREIVTESVTNFKPEDIIEILGKSIVCKDLKTDKSRRNVTAPQYCFDLLDEYRKEQRKLGYECNDDDYIFTKLNGSYGVYNPNDLTKDWGEFVKRFELKDITIHDIRHSHATYLLSMGVPIQDVSRRLGHSESATTLKIYTHSNLAQDKKITLLMEETFYKDYNSNKDLVYDNEKTKKDFDVIIKILTDNYTDNDFEDICNLLEYITNEDITYDNFENAMDLCRTYLKDEYNYFKKMETFLSDLPREKMSNFIDFVLQIDSNIINIDPIVDVEKYMDKLDLIARI